MQVRQGGCAVVVHHALRRLVHRAGATHQLRHSLLGSFQQRPRLDLPAHVVPLCAVSCGLLLPRWRAHAVPQRRVLHRWEWCGDKLHALSRWHIPAQNYADVVPALPNWLHLAGHWHFDAQSVPTRGCVRCHRSLERRQGVPTRSLLLVGHAHGKFYRFWHPGAASTVSFRHVLWPRSHHEQDDREQLHHPTDLFRGFHVRARFSIASGFGPLPLWALLPTRPAHPVPEPDLLPRRGQHRAKAVRPRSLPAGVRSVHVQEVSSRYDLSRFRERASRAVSPGFRVRRGRFTDSVQAMPRRTLLFAEHSHARSAQRAGHRPAASVFAVFTGCDVVPTAAVFTRDVLHGGCDEQPDVGGSIHAAAAVQGRFLLRVGNLGQDIRRRRGRCQPYASMSTG
mmetsp:Transcript_10983/g.50735  ORF Transcript_10983/g.50735 Transcript_10983/m.50735 type:complete len:395 (+) Transcript_10983:13086-14270(+)